LYILEDKKRVLDHGKQNINSFDALGLSEDKSKLFALLLAEEGVDSAPPQSILPRRHSEPLSLSFAQHRLWFIDQLEPGNTAYIISGTIHLSGVLDVAVLERCLNVIVERHDSLRTTFTLAEGRPIQVIAPRLWVPLALIDLRDLDRERRMIAAEHMTLAETQRSFDLTNGPLFRTTLLRLASTEHILLLSMHHIIADGWSVGILAHELTTLYSASVLGVSALLPELPVQYADYASWQREWMQGEVLDSQLAYWRAQLAQLPTLNLPTDYPRRARPVLQAAHLDFAIPRDLSAELARLCQGEGITLFMTLLAAFQVLLARYSGLDDIVVGTPIANRTRAEIEPLIGCFVNTLVIRTALAGNPTFHEVLHRVRETMLLAYTHQDLPFDKLVEELRPERDPSRTPLFQVLFVLQNTAMPELELPELRFRIAKTQNMIAKFDLSLSMSETDAGLTGTLEYCTDLFRSSTSARMVAHFQRLLAGILARPEQCIWELPLLTRAERQQLVVDWNATQVDFPANQCLHTLFEAQVARTPDVVALIAPIMGTEHDLGQHENASVTYAALNCRANQVAQHLRMLQVGPDVRVGICMERAPDLVVVLLAILKAGAAYVPLDPAYPQERLAFMLDDAQISVLFTQGHLLQRLPSYAGRVLCLERDWPTISQRGRENLGRATTSEQPAYIIYTSGSTGQPKGVQISHRAICNRLLWGQSAYPLNERDCVIQIASFSFDISIWELFGPLLAGGRVVLPAPSAQQDAVQLVKLMAAHGVTVAHFVPSMLQMILDVGPSEADAQLRGVLFGGEALTAELQAALAAQLTTDLQHMYGPTEASISATAWLCLAGSHMPSAAIGRPIANTQIYLLDGHGQPVPIGVWGEIHIGGAGLAQGYLNRPDLTAERFIPNPFATTNDELAARPVILRPSSGVRLYRTGDLARYHPDGMLQFLGRTDRQVKIRGIRIELGEIEGMLARHPAVREAAVLAQDDAQGSKRLVAYVVPTNDLRRTTKDERPGTNRVLRPSSFVSELRAFLKEHLLDAMIPAAFVLLDAWPLTPNGKIDYAALPAPSTARPALDSAFAAPRSATEQQLVAIWAELLGLEQLGIHDDFFALGGHSLMATQFAWRVRAALGVEIPLRTVFETPTVAQLADYIARSQQAAVSDAQPALAAIPRDQPLPLSFAQHRLWFLHQLDTTSPAYNIPGAVQLTGSLNILTLQQAVHAIIQRHEALRTIFQAAHGQPFQVILSAAPFRLPVVHLAAVPPGARAALVRRLAIQEAQQPFDLARGPLLRAALLRLDAQEHILIFTLHHIIADGWSISIFAQEVALVYAALLAGAPSPLPPLPIQYADFAAWQRQWPQAVFQPLLAYWRAQLAAPLPLLKLPLDRPRPPVQTVHGATQRFSLPPDRTEALKQFVRAEHATLFMGLLAAFKLLLYAYSHQPDIVVGSPIANRTRRELEGVIGCFVNTLVLRTELAGTISFRELARRVREVTLGAYAHQDLPFDKLVEELQPQRDLSYTPLFQARFILQNMPPPQLTLPDLAIRSVELDYEMVHYDLIVNLRETSAGVIGSFDYNRDLFDPATIAQMIGHFELIIERALAAPDERLEALVAPIAAAERRWHETKAHAFEDAGRDRLRTLRRRQGSREA
jgi:amino acid adenylation domain-containing protein